MEAEDEKKALEKTHTEEEKERKARAEREGKVRKREKESHDNCRNSFHTEKGSTRTIHTQIIYITLRVSKLEL